MSDTTFTDKPGRVATSTTAITTTPRPGAPAVEVATAPSAAMLPIHPVKQVLHVLASLRITVVLFVLSLLLVFYGTWAQVDASVWTVVRQYFHSYVVLLPLKVVSLRVINSEFLIPFPGGYTLGSLLLINLLAAHIVRFRFSWKRSGIILIHTGLVVMMIGEWIYGAFGLEARMFIHVGNSSSFLENDLHPEIAILDRTDPREDKVVVIPKSLLVEGTTINDPRLPFDIHIDKFMQNSDLASVKPGESLATHGVGLYKMAVRKPEVSGANTEQRVDQKSAYVTLRDPANAKEIGTFLIAYQFNHEPDLEFQPVPGHENLFISLRPKRTYLPFRIHLLDLRAEQHENSGKAKKYESLIQLVNDETGENREILISMNNPLRYQGATYYQASVFPQPPLEPTTTGFQVVTNPGWLMPYISCAIVTLGLLLHFGLHLVSFLRKRVAV